MRYFILPILFLYLLTSVEPLNAEDKGYLSELANLDIEGLMNQSVTSVLRKEQPLSKAPAAIFVITKEDIKRSGARSVPEVLRLAPGVTVVQTNSSSWNITARGFDTNTSAKLLVLIDGRSVYSPTFSGVFWDVQDLIMDNIERIEVIRGPGAVSWGENAVNGVINIITKKAKDTAGGRVIVGGGKEERGFGSVTYGDKISEDTYYRLSGKYSDHDGYVFSRDGSNSEDDWGLGTLGFRVDSKQSSKDSLTFQGDFYDGRSYLKRTILDSTASPFTKVVRDGTDLNGGNLLLRWIREYSDTSELRVQTYYDKTSREFSLYAEDRHTFDLDVQHHKKISDNHDLVYGADFRVTSDDIDGSLVVSAEPEKRTDSLFNVFVQDEMTLIPNTLNFIPGIKLGYNDYSQFDYQPAAKLLWTPDEKNTLWTSISRAVRSPARLDEDIRIFGAPSTGPDGMTSIVGLFGQKSVDAEELLAYEIGYRIVPYKDVTFDIATFYHSYDDLLLIEPGTPFLEQNPTPPHLIVPFLIKNGFTGSSYGAETVVNWKTNDWLNLSASYSYIDLTFNLERGRRDPFFGQIERATPHNQANFRAHAKLTDRLDGDAILYYVDSLPRYDVDRYFRTDLQLSYSISKNLDIALVAQGLTDSRHREWNTLQAGIDVERGFFGKVTYRFE